MKYLLAIDSFKGCLTSSEAEKAAAEGILNVDENAEIISVPVSDGGEGMIEAFSNSLKGELITAKIHDPLMRLISSEYFISTEGIAIIEIAKACGITLLSDNERNPLITTSYGVGELILDALSRGCKNFIIGLGGSATSDCGIGMLRALINSLAKDKHFDDINLDVNITLASDVTNPLYGKYGAAHVFGRQKGATAEMIEWLDLKAKKFAEI
jgi:glycerate kinase